MQEPTFSIRDLASRLAPCGIIAPSNALPFMFGNTPELAQKLASLVAQGRKSATAGLLWVWEADDGGPPNVGQIYIVHNWEGATMAVIEMMILALMTGITFGQQMLVFGVFEKGKPDTTFVQ